MGSDSQVLDIILKKLDNVESQLLGGENSINARLVRLETQRKAGLSTAFVVCTIIGFLITNSIAGFSVYVALKDKEKPVEITKRINT